ncbi:hypothetical protein DFH09DRAFT_1434462 [Mycena vulgaris]|nr:hypothetical protein DFH09DRAFT_1434462 [Mycena vulgaris]
MNPAQSRGILLKLDVGVSLEVRVTDTFVARTSIGWSNITANLDLLHGNQSYIGNWVRRKPVQLISAASLSARVFAGPYVSAGFGVYIFGNKLQVGCQLGSQTTLQIGAVFNTNKLDGGCPGVEPTLRANITTKTIDGLLVDQAPRMIAPMDPNIAYRTLAVNVKVDGKQQLLQVLFDGTPGGMQLIVQPALENVTESTSIYRIFRSVASANSTDTTVNTYDGRLIYYYSDEPQQYSIARIGAALSGMVPERAVALLNVMVCSFFDGSKPPRLFAISPYDPFNTGSASESAGTHMRRFNFITKINDSDTRANVVAENVVDNCVYSLDCHNTLS